MVQNVKFAFNIMFYKSFFGIKGWLRSRQTRPDVDPEPPKRIKRLLREYAAQAYEEELRRALAPLAEAFDHWSRRELESSALCDLIHEFHQGPARDLHVRYDRRHWGMAIAYAITTGVIDRASVPAELLEHLRGALEFYDQRPSE